jgi:hypothetical protein
VSVDPDIDAVICTDGPTRTWHRDFTKLCTYAAATLKILLVDQ